jgi:hypothetical protein
MRVLHANGPVENTHSVVGQSGLTSPVSAGGSRIVVVSSNANDTSGGTGVRTLIIVGKKSGRTDEDLTFESLTMNGTSNVTTTSIFDEVHSVAIGESGDNGIDGNITITNGSSTIAKIKADYGILNDAIIQPQGTVIFESICIYGDSTDSNTIYEISIVENSGKNDTVLYTLYWDTDKDTHEYPLRGIVSTGNVVYVRAKNLKHSGPDNVSVKLYYSEATQGLPEGQPFIAGGSSSGSSSSSGGGGGGY